MSFSPPILRGPPGPPLAPWSCFAISIAVFSFNGLWSPRRSGRNRSEESLGIWLAARDTGAENTQDKDAKGRASFGVLCASQRRTAFRRIPVVMVVMVVMNISFLPNNAHICATKKHCWGGMKWGCRGNAVNLRSH